MEQKRFVTTAQATGDHPPFAQFLGVKMPERGDYAGGGPAGAIFHFTAGRLNPGAVEIAGGAKQGFTYWVNQYDGKLVCAHRAGKWGFHAGVSFWKGLVVKGRSVHTRLIGIEHTCYGQVQPVKGKPGKFVTWFGLELDASEVRYTEGKDNQAKGWYHKLSAAQEETMIQTCLWLKDRFPKTFSYDDVLGHDEVSGKKGLGYFRKTDPGAALSCTMSEFREKLKQRDAERAAARK